MDTRNGDTYPSRTSALEAGVPAAAIAEVRGPKRAIGRVRMACRRQWQLRKARRKVEKASRRRNRVGLLLLALLPAFAQAWEPEYKATVEVLAGAGVSLSDDSAVVPVATVTVDAPVYVGEDGDSVARLRAALRLHGSPGQTLDLSDVRTFQGAELDLQLERRIGSGDDSATYAVIGGGFATRRDAPAKGAGTAAASGESTAPAQRFPIYYSAGLAVEHREGGQAPSRRLVVGIGSSQVCHPESLIPRDLVVSGHVRLLEVKGASLVLQGDVQRPLWGGGRGVFRMAALVGWQG